MTGFWWLDGEDWEMRNVLPFFVCNGTENYGDCHFMNEETGISIELHNLLDNDISGIREQLWAMIEGLA